VFGGAARPSRAQRRIAQAVNAHLEDGAKAAAAQRLRERQAAHRLGPLLAAAVAPSNVLLQHLVGFGVEGFGAWALQEQNAG
jgi:hypothetical protein